MSSFLRAPKKDSAIALSQQMPVRPIEAVIRLFVVDGERVVVS